MSDSSTIWSLRIACGRSPNSAAACSVQDTGRTVRPTVRPKLRFHWLIVLRISARSVQGTSPGAETRDGARGLGRPWVVSFVLDRFIRPASRFANLILAAASTYAAVPPAPCGATWSKRPWRSRDMSYLLTMVVVSCPPESAGRVEECHGDHRRDVLGRDRVPISLDVFRLFQNSNVNMYRGYSRAIENGRIPFSNLKFLAGRAEIPYPLFFAPLPLVEAQVKAKTDKLLAGTNKTTFSVSSGRRRSERGRIDRGRICCASEDAQATRPRPEEEQIVGLLRRPGLLLKPTPSCSRTRSGCPGTRCSARGTAKPCWT